MVVLFRPTNPCSGRAASGAPLKDDVRPTNEGRRDGDIGHAGADKRDEHSSGTDGRKLCASHERVASDRRPEPFLGPGPYQRSFD